MELFFHVLLQTFDTLVVIFGLYVVYNIFYYFWICLVVVVLAQILTQLTSLILSARPLGWTGYLTHLLQIGLSRRLLRAFTNADMKDAELRTVARLRLIRTFTGNITLIYALTFYVFSNEISCDWKICASLVALLLSTSISVANVTKSPLILAVLWRLFEVTFRFACLVVLALAFGWWASLSILAHFLAMFLWCFTFDLFTVMKPRALLKRVLVNLRTSYVLCWCFADLRSSTSLRRTIAFYCIIVTENWILFAAWLLQGGLKHANVMLIVVTVALTSSLTMGCVAVHCILGRRQVLSGENNESAPSIQCQTKPVTGENLSPMNECRVYEELGDSQCSTSDVSGNTSPGSQTRLVTDDTCANPMTPITIYTIAGNKFQIVDGAWEGERYSIDVPPCQDKPPRVPKNHPKNNDNCDSSIELENPYAITLLSTIHHDQSQSLPGRKCGIEAQRSPSPHYDICGPGLDSVCNRTPNVPKQKRKKQCRNSYPVPYREPPGYDMARVNESSLSSASPVSLEEEARLTVVTSYAGRMNKSPDHSAAASLSSNKSNGHYVEQCNVPTGSGLPRSRHPVDSSICTGANSIFGETDFERSEYDSSLLSFVTTDNRCLRNHNARHTAQRQSPSQIRIVATPDFYPSPNDRSCVGQTLVIPQSTSV